jgi:hypothetical protein
MADEEELERRINERAYRIWLDEGQPQGRDKEHWELAKFAVAQEDGLASTLVRPLEPQSEPIDAVENAAKFPILVDQGEGLPPVDWGKHRE